MEPPPRRDKSIAIVFKKLQEAHTECFNKKHHLEMEFLTRFKTYCKLRSEAEAEYAQTLVKLSQQCGLNEQQAHDLGYSNRSLYAVWNGFLDDGKKTAKQHMDMAKFFNQNIGDNLKSLQNSHLEAAKKAFERLNRIHHELQLTAKDVDRFKREYSLAQQTGAEASVKAQTLTKKLQQNKKAKKEQILAELEKLETAIDDANRTAVDRRNLCLLYTEALKAHQTRYRDVDLPALVKDFEHDLYGQVWTFLSTIELIEQEMYRTLDKARDTLHSDITQAITPEEHSHAFLNSDNSLRHPIKVIFEPDATTYTFGDSTPDDTHIPLIINRETDACLYQEARKWMASVTRHERIVEETKTKLGQFEKLHQHAVDNARMNPAAQLPSSDSSLAELNRQIAATSEMLRKEETALIKAQTIVAFLKNSGFNLNDLNASRSPSFMSTTGSTTRTNSQTSLASSSNSSDYAALGRRCTAKFDYKAVQEDELTLRKGEELLIIDNPSDTQWPKARNSRGQTGVVPQNYIQPAVEGRGETTPVQEDYDRQKYLPPPISPKPAALFSKHSMCEALLDYEADTSGELGFRFGEKIIILDKRPHGVDDGYWMGEHKVTGQRGTFASLMVKEILEQEAEFKLDKIKPPALPAKPEKPRLRDSWPSQAESRSHERFLKTQSLFQK